MGCKAAKAAAKLPDPLTSLEGVEAASYIAVAVSANDFALDRPDAAHATHELCRCASFPPFVVPPSC